ncbi:MAG: phytoene desaturase family protein [Halieaceae bacterium]|nr:phytoene desaturase family protein [Halieaceae bacterium]
MVGRVAVIGAGMAGLSATLRLLAAGREVVLIEGADYAGGKMRQVDTPAGPVDSGPTVFTMRSVFEELLAGLDLCLEDVVTARPLNLLARHAWDGAGHLDLFADRDASAQAIGEFAGAREAKGYLAFCKQAGQIFDLLEPAMLRAPRPSPLSLSWRARGAGITGLLGLRPFTSMWKALGEHFRDPRLQQLFGRYATYCGSSPWQSPATLMLIAHLEQEGVWQLDGGMQSLAQGLARVARKRGAEFHDSDWVADIDVRAGRVAGLRTVAGRYIACDAVVCTADLGALRAGKLGEAARGAVPGKQRQRSLSAVTWSMAAETQGFPLAYHTVFFSSDYKAEFDALFGRQQIPAEPTIYVCAQDRLEQGSGPAGSERIFCLANAPAIGDSHRFSDEEVAECQQSMFRKLQDCGLQVTPTSTPLVRTPSDFAARFPGSGGAIYGQATHGWLSAFQRPGARSRLPGLYLAGGGVHPGAGVPMVTLSGMLAADAVLSDPALTSRSWPGVTAGGTSMR